MALFGCCFISVLHVTFHIVFVSLSRLTDQQIEVIAQRATTECGARLSFEQFETMVAAAEEMEQRDEDLARSLLVFESGKGTGKIDVALFRHAMCSLGDKMTAAEVPGRSDSLWG
jgi:Ca2+-binding EF-hand superfamily protein